MLELHEWNVETALRSVTPGRSRRRSCWDNWVFRLALKLFSESHTFVSSFFPGSSHPPTLLQSHHAFLLRFEALYGSFHPDFTEGSLFDAMAAAKRQCKFVLVFLHSSLHGDSEKFCLETFSSQPVVEFINRNFILWAADSSSRVGHEAAASLQAHSYPFFAVLFAENSTQRNGGLEIQSVGSMVGFMTVDELIAQLISVMDENDRLLEADRSVVRNREQTRRLLQEQDADYEAALLADRGKKISRKTEESDLEEKVVVEKEKEEIVKVEADCKIQLPSEPGAGESEAVLVAMRLPGGRLERRFRLEEKVGVLFAAADASGLTEMTDVSYLLVGAYPRVVFRRNDPRTLRQAEFRDKIALIFEEEE